MSIRALWPSTQPSSCSPRRKAEIHLCANELFSVRFTITAIRRIGPVCCARAASGQAAADPAITLMKSRRRPAFPQGWAPLMSACDSELSQEIAPGGMWYQSPGSNSEPRLVGQTSSRWPASRRQCASGKLRWRHRRAGNRKADNRKIRRGSNSETRSAGRKGHRTSTTETEWAPIARGG
jgi:hypothetical protein